MNYREATLLAETGITADKVEIIDLDFRDICSRLDIFYRYSASKHGMDDYGYADITKIEIVDGSDVLMSVSGAECQALNIYNRGAPSMSYGQHWSGNSEFNTFGVDFGRFLWDRDYAFDPSKYTNPQLKVSVDFGTTDTGITTSYLTVKAHMFDDRKVTPRGYMMAKEHFSYTCGADGTYEYVELPQDYPIRQMILRAYRSGYEPWNVIEDVRLDINNEAKVPFDINVEEYFRSRVGVDPVVEEYFIAEGQGSAITYFVTPTQYWCCPIFQPQSELTTQTVAFFRGGTGSINADANANLYGIVRGHLPHHCVRFPFGMKDDPSDWFNVAAIDKARLRLEAGGSGTDGTGAIVLEQLRTY